MDISELDDLETSVQDLLAVAQMELETKRLQQQRDQQVEKALLEIQQRLEPLLQQVEGMLVNYASEASDSPIRKKLEEKAADIRQQLAEAPSKAAQIADRLLILNEERLLDARVAEQTAQWQQALRADLLEMIAEQEDFFSATDASVAIRAHLDDLKAIGGLADVVDALIARINACSEEGPVAKLRGSHEQTLNFIYGKALENRSRIDYVPNVQPRTRHRTTEKPPNPYTQLEGKVVIFGGHDRLETAVRNRLRDSDVELIWCTAQAGLQIAEQGENHVRNADLVLIITGYASHSLTEKAMRTMQRVGKSPEMINTTGMTKVLEAIELGLKTKLLERRFNFSKPA